MRHCNRLDIADLHVGRIHERVDTLDARDEFEAPADIERCARGGGHEHAVDASGLAGPEAIGIHGQHGRWSTVGVDQLGGQARLDPLAPNIAAADKPASTPIRRDHNQAACAR